MKTADIAALLVAGMQQQGNGNTDIGMHTGVVQAWDDTTGLNSVLINGSTFDNLSVITAGPAINIEAGDTVVIFRIQTQYFIFGKVAAAGASAAMRSVSDFTAAGESTSSSTFTDLATVGPTVTAYVGPSKQALVMLSTSVTVPIAVTARMSFAISGASTQAAATFRSAHYFSGEAGAIIRLSNIVQVVDLTPGLNTFTAKYLSDGGSTAFVNRSLAVIPM